MILFYHVKAQNLNERKNWYAVVRVYNGLVGHEGAKKILAGSPYKYTFVGRVLTEVTVKRVALNTAVSIIQKSKGAGSYGWMIDSIETRGAIVDACGRGRESMERKQASRRMWNTKKLIGDV
jgi:hypothetical protein